MFPKPGHGGDGALMNCPSSDRQVHAVGYRAMQYSQGVGTPSTPAHNPMHAAYRGRAWTVKMCRMPHACMHMLNTGRAVVGDVHCGDFSTYLGSDGAYR